MKKFLFFSINLLTYLSIQRESTLESLRSDGVHPKVEAIERCRTSVKRLKEGPDDFQNIIEEGKKYKDKSFRRRDQLYWPRFTSWSDTYDYNSLLI